MKINDAMKEIAELNAKGSKGTVNLKGKTYTSVATRIEVLRKHLGLDVGIDTEIMFPVRGVIVITKIRDKDGRLLASGHSYADNLSKEKSLEKLESVSVGRACACLGLGGGEYASDVELESWQVRYEEGPPPIHMEYGEDDVDPETWLNSTIENMYAYVDKPRSTVEKFVITCGDKRIDPIFSKLTDEQKETFEIAVSDAGAKLEKRFVEERKDIK